MDKQIGLVLMYESNDFDDIYCFKTMAEYIKSFFFFFFFSFLMCLILLIAEGQVRIVSAIVIIRVIVCTNKKLASNKNYGTRMDAPSDV